MRKRSGVELVFAQTQQVINDGWKQRKKPVDPVHQRKAHLCPKCGKDGYRVKMDYLGNKHVRYELCWYNFDLYRCPRCKHLDKEWSRIEGKGKQGVNLGRLYGTR